MKTANGTQVTSYEYDSINRIKKITDPLGQSENYNYLVSDANNMARMEKTDRNGNVITYYYDFLKRLQKIEAKTPGNVVTTTKYTHSCMGNIFTEENENLKSTYKYNNMGQLINVSENNGTEKQYTYDIAGNRKSFKLLQSGTTRQNITYDYDKLNRLTKVYENGTLIATYTYDDNGNRAGLTYNNGVAATYQYNKANMVTSLTNKKGTATISSYAYTYYLDGNQETKTDNTGKKTTYVYDGSGRLKSEAETGGNQPAITQAYTYTTAGNRNTMTVTGAQSYTNSYTYDKNNRLLTETKTAGSSTETQNYSYDKNGNQIKVTKGNSTEQNTYDAFNRLIQVQKGSTTATFVYKADGMRLSKTVNGTKTTHVWDGDNIVLDLNGGGTVTNSYVRGINLIKSTNNGYYLYNAHGDVTVLTNTAGTVTKSYDYDAFGVEKNPAPNDTNPFRYCSEYFDVMESGAPTQELPESAHPYANNYDNTWTWTWTQPWNVDSLYVTFSSDTETENNYDYIYIMNKDGGLIGKYSGTQLAGKTITVPGNGVRIRLTSDGSVTKNGFKVTGITPALPESEHPYETDYDNTWTWTYPGAASSLNVTFSSDTNVEANYDFIYIMDKDGNEIGEYTGTELAGKTITVPGNVVKIRLTSDIIATDYGFKVTGITPALPESEHPYAVDYDETWTVTYPGAASSLNVTFSHDTSVETNFDFIYIMDKNGNEIGEYTGTELAGKTITVPGNVVKIRLTSDVIIPDYGFRVTDVTAVDITADSSVQGMYYLRNRYYNPSNGRFLTEDPIRDGLNWYTYCANNPIMYIDPTGENLKDTLNGAAEVFDENNFFGLASFTIKKITGETTNYHESEYDYYLGRTIGGILSAMHGVGIAAKGITTIIASITRKSIFR